MLQAWDEDLKGGDMDDWDDPAEEVECVLY
jgi:hypothetical protein